MKHLKAYRVFESNHTWNEVGDKLQKQFEFKDFTEALEFINKLAEVCESENHHPEINWIYNKITLSLSTHDAGDVVTEKDIHLSKMIDDINTGISGAGTMSDPWIM